MNDPTPEQLAQWAREATQLQPSTHDSDRFFHAHRQGYLAARLKAHQEQSARIQELEEALTTARKDLAQLIAHEWSEEDVPSHRIGLYVDEDKRIQQIDATLSGGRRDHHTP